MLHALLTLDPYETRPHDYLLLSLQGIQSSLHLTLALCRCSPVLNILLYILCICPVRSDTRVGTRRTRSIASLVP
jgi:hypothetical protein